MTRHTDHHTGRSFQRKLVTWLAVIVLTAWIAREPAQAAAVFHTIAQALGNLAQHLSHPRTTTP